MADFSSTPHWNGRVNLINVANFGATALPFKSDSNISLLPHTLEITEGTSLELMWIRFHAWKEHKISIFILLPSSAIDDTGHLILLKFLETRKRFGVVHLDPNLAEYSYLMPLPAGSPLPEAIQQCVGVPLEKDHPDLMVVIVMEKETKPTVFDTPSIDEPGYDRMYNHFFVAERCVYDSYDEKVFSDGGAHSDDSIESPQKEEEK